MIDPASEALRAPLVEQVDRLATDLRLGRHGDPYMAFVVLVHPERCGTVLTVMAGQPPIDMSALRRGDGANLGLPFPTAEFEEASRVMDDARLGLHMVTWRRGAMQPGVVISEYMQQQWEQRRMAPIARALQQADEEAARPAKCPYCTRRFTERGLPMHLSKSRWCGPGGEGMGAESDD